MLNDQQRRIVEENHNLIYAFMNQHKLDSEEYYGLCAIGLCKAAETMDKNKHYSLSTYAFKCMENEIRDSIRGTNAEKRKSNKGNISIFAETDKGREYYITDLMPDQKNFEKNSIFKVQILNKIRILSHTEKFLVKSYLMGDSVKDICNKTGFTHQYIYRCNKQLRNKLADIK